MTRMISLMLTTTLPRKPVQILGRRATGNVCLSLFITGEYLICLSLSLAHQEEKELVSPLTPSEVDWDSLYEEEAEEAEVDMKSHGSVITHLLSQESLGNCRAGHQEFTGKHKYYFE